MVQVYYVFVCLSFTHSNLSIPITMSFPGLPNRGLGGDSTAGMSDQEAKMVKAVRFPLQIQEEARFLARARS